MQIFHNLRIDPLERATFHAAERKRQQQRLYGGRKPSSSRALASPRGLQPGDEEIAGEEDEAWDAGDFRYLFAAASVCAVGVCWWVD